MAVLSCLFLQVNGWGREMSPRTYRVRKPQRAAVEETTSAPSSSSSSSLSMPQSLPKGSNSEKSLMDLARMPGTKWCGKGWRVDSFHSMGAYSGADRCCRQHDLSCPESIGPGQKKYGLQNMRFHAVMHCTCDDRFRTCLRMAQTTAADTVGNLFFNVINIPCFVFKQEKVCTSKTWWGACIRHNTQKVAVWRDTVSYSRI